MNTCKLFLQRPFAGDPFSNYAMSSSDVREFFVKVMFYERSWQGALAEYDPFDPEDLTIEHISPFANGALVRFTCAEWVLSLMKNRYEVNKIEINSVDYERRQLHDRFGGHYWSYVTGEGPWAKSFFPHLQPYLSA